MNGPKDKNHVGVSDIKIHPEFNAFNYDNDFAILTLEKPVSFNEKIQQVCLPKDTERGLSTSSLEPALLHSVLLRFNSF